MGGVNFETFQPDIVADGDFVGSTAEPIDTDESDGSSSATRARPNDGDTSAVDEAAAAERPISSKGPSDAAAALDTAHIDSSQMSANNSAAGGAAEDDDDDDLEEYDTTGEEFGVVMTGMFLQGIAAPIHRQETRASEVAMDAVPVDITPTSELRKSTFDRSSAAAQPAPLFPAHVDESAVEQDASTFEVHDVLQHDGSQLDVTGGASPLPLAAASGGAGMDSSPIPAASAGDVSVAVMPQRTNSPSVYGNDRKAAKQREFNALSASLAHFRKLRPQTVGGPAAGRASVAVVQGSIDTEGIEALLLQLSALGTAKRPDVTSENLKEQNLRMQWALEEQQRQIQAMVGRLRAGIRKAEFSAIVKHLKGSKLYQPRAAGSCSPQSDQVQMSFASLPARSDQPLLTDRSVQGAAEDLRTSQQIARIPALVLANPPGMVGLASLAPPERMPPPPLPASGVNARSASPVTAGRAKPPRPDGIINVSVTSLRQKVGQPQGSPSTPAAPGDQTLQIPQLQKLRERHQKRQEAKAAGATAAAAGPQPCFPLQQQGRGPAPAPSSGKQSPRSQEAQPALAAATAAAPDAVVPPIPSVPSGAAPSAGGAPLLPTTATGIVPLLAPVIKMRSNKLGITNALKHVLLTGSLNKSMLDNALKVLQEFSEKENNQFVILLKDEYAHQFRGVYVVKPDNSVTKIFGSGPTNALAPAAVPAGTATQGAGGGAAGAEPQGLDPKFYKFDSSSKKFTPLPSKFINQMTDALVFSGLKQPPKERERW
jgi:hypothetical protein